MLFAEFAFSPPVAIGLAAAAGLFALSRIQRRAAARRAQQGSAQRDAGHAAHSSAAMREVEAWEVRMYDLARDLSAQLDTKMVAIQQLLDRVEGERDKLERLIADATLRAEAVAALHKPPAATHADSQPADAPPIKSSARARCDEIYYFSDYGFSTAEIAERVGSPIGEVELILSLRDKAS